jgi:hypothetical protein
MAEDSERMKSGNYNNGRRITMKNVFICCVIIYSIYGAYVINTKNKELAECKRIQNIEYRLHAVSAKMWELKTKLEFPEFPPKVGVKAFPFHKTSMKYKTKRK